jgi:hypothetical protein
MKFALLGADAESAALADAAVAAGHVVAWREGESPPAVGAWANNAWEGLFDSTAADAILVGAAGDPEQRARQVQELAKLGRPLLAVHPVVPSVISYFEIDLARGDGGGVLQHYNPVATGAGAEQLEAWVRDGHPRLGAIEQIVATRHAADRSQPCVLRHFARDVELLARLAGRLDRIGAHAASADPDAAYSSLSVQLSGPRQIPVRWAIEPPSGDAALRVTLIGQRGRATLERREGDGAGVIAEQGPNGETRTPANAAAPPAAAAIARFATAVAARDGAASTWPAALDAMELADSIEISLRRGRMIDVHHRELTEQLAFKGVMSAVGCGVLVVLVPLLIAAGGIAGALGIPLSHYWPHALLALLASFLGLQLAAKLLLRPKSPAAPDGAAAEAAPGRDSK